MQLIILGSGTCAPTKHRSCACYYLKIGASQVLLDIGFGAIRRMMEAGVDYRHIDYVLVSHTHLDHVADLGPLLMALEYTPNFIRTKPLTIIGPKGFREYMHHLARIYSPWIVEPTHYELRIIDVHNQRISFGDWQVTAMPMEHSKETNGYRIQQNDKVFAYSGDTGLCEEVVQLLTDADLALLECSFPDDEAVEGHMTPSLAGQVAVLAACKKLVLTHLYPMMDKMDVVGPVSRIYRGPVLIARDLQIHTI